MKSNNEMAGACSSCGGQERYIQAFVWDTCGKEALGRPRRRTENNIMLDLQEVIWGRGLD
jgi:hypothetical protein